MSIGSNIRRLRRAKDWTQEQLAEMVGVSRPLIAQLEGNLKPPTVPLGKAIAEALGCTLDELAADGDSVAS